MNYKTNKTIAKRFKITKKGKVIKRACGQDHFNARDPGKKIRLKRKDFPISKSFVGVIKKNIISS
jgi:ribosomal protein L35